MTDKELLTVKEYLLLIHPNYKTKPYDDGMFLKGSKDKTIKSAMSNLRVVYSKYSGKTSGCFCKRGIAIILEWLIKLIDLKEKEEKETKE